MALGWGMGHLAIIEDNLILHCLGDHNPSQ